MTPWISQAITFAFALAGALLLPWVGMRMLVPTLEAEDRSGVTNFRGRRVVYGLGFVWVMWVIGVQLSGALLDLISLRFWADWSFPPSGADFLIFTQPVLVLGALALGLADDVFGSAADRGFRGHLRALRSGRLSTGGLKLLGIGLLAAGVTLPSVTTSGTLTALPGILGQWVLATLAIALTANFLNLMDLRPGRALKVYSATAVVLLLIPTVMFGFAGSPMALCILLGPVIAVWGYDLGERAMLGDAGANAAGALLGWIAVQALASTWMLAIYVALVLAANIASERISFTAVIGSNRILSWLDGLGRLPAEQVNRECGEKSSSEVTAAEK